MKRAKPGTRRPPVSGRRATDNGRHNTTYVVGKYIFSITSVAAITVGLYHSIVLRWVGDDIFITFRYIQNWFDGKGLVYNAGEYVEGYTHFLWLIILAAARGLGANPVGASIWLGIVAFLGMLVLVIRITQRSALSGTLAIPYAALALAFNHDVNVWASGGLETALFTMLLVAAYFIFYFSKWPPTQRLLFSGAALALATLSRPDGALFIVLANVLLIADFFIRRTSSVDLQSAAPNARTVLRDLAFFNAVAVILGVPYLAWKISYYGDIFPATYYAKSGGVSYFEQGFFYIWLYAKAYLTSGLFVIAVPILCVVGWRKHIVRPSLIAALGVVLYLVIYVARVGGDFMYARFIVPMAPFIYLVVEDAVRRVADKGWIRQTIIFTVLLVSVLYENQLRNDVLFDYKSNGEFRPKWAVDSAGNDALGEDRGIVDEHWYYTRPLMKRADGKSLNTVEVYTLIGEDYRTLFDSLNIGICEPGGQNIIAYYSHVPTGINYYGLTDNHIALQPLTHRGRIGHEKTASDEYLASRNVSFKLDRLTPNVPDTAGAQFNEAWFNFPSTGMWQRTEIISYDRSLMAALHKRFHDLRNPSYIADYDTLVDEFTQTLMYQMDTTLVRRTYENLKMSFFVRYPDSVRQREIERRLE